MPMLMSRMSGRRIGRALLAVGSILIGLFVAVGSAMQEPETRADSRQSPAEPVLTLRASTSAVNMLFTVRDGKGKLVKNLGQDQFRVTDNGHPQQVTYFTEEASEPLALAIVFDKSRSVEGEFDFQRRTTADFLRSILRPDRDRALLLTFDNRPYLTVDFTDRDRDFREALAGLTAEHGTALFDAARTAIVEHLSGATERRKALVLVTDGEDTVSWTTRQEVETLALTAEVIVYALGVRPSGDEGDPDKARAGLLRLSQATGGLAFFPQHDPGELARMFARVEDELRHQYRLGYAQPPSKGQAFHEVTIQPVNPNYRVHTRRGYYAAQAVGSWTDADSTEGIP